MRITLRELRQIIRETYEQTYGTKELGDDMNRIVSYGKDLGLDDEENPQKHEVQSHRPGNVKPSMMLGHGYEDDPENSFEDETTVTMGQKNEMFEPGYQETISAPNYNFDDLDTPKKKNQESNAWDTCLELFDKVRNEWGLKSMADPTFVDFALDELAKEGTTEAIITRMRFRLENENGG